MGRQDAPTLSCVDVSRESMMKRYAFNNAEGPKNLSGLPRRMMGMKLNNMHKEYIHTNHRSVHDLQETANAL